MTNPNPPHEHRSDGPCAPAYPLPSPAGGDRRFTVGLALDVAAVLARHGYPPLSAGTDLAHWQRTLFAGLYTTPRTELTA